VTAAGEYPLPVVIRNNTGWATGARTGARTGGLRRWGINLILFGAFALVAAGAASVANNADLPMDLLMVAGVVLCLAGWRLVVVARRRPPVVEPSTGPADPFAD
jgi:threonine/homoserine/homoserine lactone efflux protein